MAEFLDPRFFIYRIDAQNRIVFLSREWLDFARENQAPELTETNLLGRDLGRFITGWEVRHLYDLIYQKVRSLNEEVCFPFRCDSPGMNRFMEMRISRAEEGAIVFNARLIRAEPHPPIPLLDPTAEHSAEIIAICSWCKRIRTNEDHWSEIQVAIDQRDLFGAIPPQLTHGVCPDCSAELYRRSSRPDQDNRSD